MTSSLYLPLIALVVITVLFTCHAYAISSHKTQHYSDTLNFQGRKKIKENGLQLDGQLLQSQKKSKFARLQSTSNSYEPEDASKLPTITNDARVDVENKTEAKNSNEKISEKIWPCNDALDRRILTIVAPAVLNLAIIPLVGMVDTFWVGRMRSALALAGQGAANQVFSSTSFFIAFLPALVTPLIAKAAASGDQDAVRKFVGEALFLGVIMGVLGTFFLTVFTDNALSSVLSKGAPAISYAKPYLFIRALTFLPALMSTIAFSVFRGTLDVITPLKISLISNLLNLILDPILIFNMGMGISGAAVATCAAELLSFFLFVGALIKAGLIQTSHPFEIPSFASLKPLLIGGVSIQLRAAALNLSILSVVRRAQTLDNTGILAAAHSISIQLWQFGSIFLFAMSAVANILVPAELAKRRKEGDPMALHKAKFVADRLLLWGLLLGCGLAVIQLGSLPLLKLFSPLPAVQLAARWPSVIGAGIQVMNGVVFVGEGIQQGNQHFTSLAAVTGLATIAILSSLSLIGTSLPGIWLCFVTFSAVRLIGVLTHHFFTGPFSRKAMINESRQVK